MNADLRALTWPQARLPEAVRALALESGLAQAPAPLPKAAQWAEEPGECIELAANCLELEAQPVEAPYVDFARRLRSMGPALLRLPDGDQSAFLALAAGGRVVAPDHKLHRVPADVIRAAACEAMEAPLLSQIEEVLDRAGLPKARRPPAREAILRERFAARPVGGIWLLRLPPAGDFWRQLLQVRIPQKVAVLASLHAVQYALWLVAWWLVGAAALGGRFERAWLITWALLLLTLVPLRVTITWLQGLVAIGGGAILKQRLFDGALHLAPDSIRHQGVGQLLGRVIESEAVEALALSGGFLGLVAVIELIFAAVVLGVGASGVTHLILLTLWIGFTVFAARSYQRRYRQWTDTRLSMTHDLVENMVGHRTRVVQQSPDVWHDEEDQALEKYLKESSRVDRWSSVLLAAVPRGWMLLGLTGLIPAVSGGAPVPRVAVSVGGILLAWRAFKRLSAGLSQVVGAAEAWRRVAPLFQAASQNRHSPATDAAVPAGAKEQNQAVMEARNLVFRYQPGGDGVLRNCDLRILRNERVVLEGSSGSGKSTLVSLLMGVRRPESGVLEIGGRDAKQLGTRAWRRTIAAAPQFQDNHVLAETLAFNLLMARDRVPNLADIAEAEEIARELGLGELIDRMPSGMLQMVGETGWQLSHGERSRLYIARALLQKADLVVLDESFAALDPENLKLVIDCVLKRARALLVVAHR